MMKVKIRSDLGRIVGAWFKRVGNNYGVFLKLGFWFNQCFKKQSTRTSRESRRGGEAKPWGLRLVWVRRPSQGVTESTRLRRTSQVCGVFNCFFSFSIFFILHFFILLENNKKKNPLQKKKKTKKKQTCHVLHYTCHVLHTACLIAKLPPRLRGLVFIKMCGKY